MPIYSGEEAKLPTITSNYHKRQSNGVFIRSPFDPNMERLLTVKEHARAKGCPESLVKGLCQSHGHAFLGNGVIIPAFKAAAITLGRLLTESACEAIHAPAFHKPDVVTVHHIKPPKKPPVVSEAQMAFPI